jgi:Flp pilus assembly pilin Flp
MIATLIRLVRNEQGATARLYLALIAIAAVGVLRM